MINKDLIRTALISLIISIISSAATYLITVSKIPKFVTVDLLYLNNNFITNLSKYKLENGSSEQEITLMVRDYTSKIEPLLDEISKSGNVILLQKQAIITKTEDITPQIAKALFKDYLPDTKSDNLNFNQNENEE
jgi:hypothetical protein